MFCDACVSYNGWLGCCLVLLMGVSRGVDKSVLHLDDRWLVDGGCVRVFRCMGGFSLVRHSSHVLWTVLRFGAVGSLHFKCWLGVLCS